MCKDPLNALENAVQQHVNVENSFSTVEEETKYFDLLYYKSGAIETQSAIAQFFDVDSTILSTKEQLYLDLFLFSYYTGGSSILELATLTQEDVDDDYIYIERYESEIIAKIPLFEGLLEIIERYKEKSYSDYLLPIYNHHHSNHNEKLKRTDQITMLANQTLRDIATKIGIEQSVSMDITKRIFIESLLENLVPIEYISECVGCCEETVKYHHKMMIK